MEIHAALSSSAPWLSPTQKPLLILLSLLGCVRSIKVLLLRTRLADDWVITCKSAAETRAAVETAGRILKQLGVELHPQKTRIVHVREGFEFLRLRTQKQVTAHPIPEG